MGALSALHRIVGSLLDQLGKSIPWEVHGWEGWAGRGRCQARTACPRIRNRVVRGLALQPRSMVPSDVLTGAPPLRFVSAGTVPAPGGQRPCHTYEAHFM